MAHNLRLQNKYQRSSSDQDFQFILKASQVRNLKIRLTFFTVFPFPAGKTRQLTIPGAGVVTEPVVSGRALFGTAFPIVALVADEPIGISKLRLFLGLCVLGPVGSYAQLSLDGKKANHKVWIVGICKR